jgi:hypothetical protein
LIGWIADTQSNGPQPKRHRQDKLFWALERDHPTAAQRPRSPCRALHIEYIDNNSLYYSFAKTIPGHSLGRG